MLVFWLDTAIFLKGFTAIISNADELKFKDFDSPPRTILVFAMMPFGEQLQVISN